MMRLVFILCFIFLFAAGCQDTAPPPPPGNALDEKQFVEVMVDVHLVEAALNQQFVRVNDTTRTSYRYYSQVFDKHGISRTEFDSTFNYYLRHPKLMNKIYKQVHDSLKALAIDLEENEEKYRKMEDDTARAVPIDTTGLIHTTENTQQ